MQELVTEIKMLLSQSMSEKHLHSVDEAARDADLSWDASRFFAELVHKAEPSGFYKSLDQYIAFKEEYQESNNIHIDDDRLFQDCWLRNVLGFVVVSGGISSLGYRFREIRNYKNELLFWLEFQQEHKSDEKKTIDKIEVDRAAEIYEQKHNIQLDREGIYFKQWISLKENQAEYSDFLVYFKQYIDHWDDFAFLADYEKFKSDKEEKALWIKKDDLEGLHESFKLFFPKIPSIEELKEQKIITENTTHFLLDFHNTEPRYWEALKDKIGGHLWELLISDNKYTNDKQRLKDWLTKLLYWPMWPDPLPYTTRQSATRYLDAAFELAIDDTDLTGAENELRKVCLDGRLTHDSLLALERPIHSNDFTLDTTGYYELLESFNKWEGKARTTYLHSQGSRYLLTYLLSTIVRYDAEYSQQQSTESTAEIKQYFHKVITLLEESSQKPFLMWEVTRFIIKDRQEVIPYLVTTKGMESLAFILLDEIAFLLEQKPLLNLELWKKTTQLFLKNLSRENTQEAANKVFQVYRSLNKNKYEIPYNRSNKEHELETREQHERKEEDILGLLEDSRFHQHMHNQRQSEFLFPVLYKELAVVIMNYSTEPWYRNGTVQFPIMQWDAMCWLLKASTYWKYHDQKDAMTETADLVTKEFLKRYLESIEVDSIKKYDYLEEKEELGIPLWSEKIERLHFIEWIYPIYFINERGLLAQFLSPRIDIEHTTDRYHEKNRFSADKLRTHIGVLLQVLRSFLLPVLPYGFEKNELKQIKDKIESQIVDFLRTHIKDEPAAGKIDLFDFNKEWQFQATDKEALFPQIARAINWFSDRDTIIDTISQTGDISKLLTLLDLVKSEGVRQKLVSKIQSLDIQTFLENYNWIPEIEHAVTRLSSHPELLPQIDQAIEYWKQNVMTRKDKADYQMVLFKAELLAAYFRKSESQIDAVTEPTLNYHSQHELNPGDYKQFYKALLYIETDPAKSHKLFDDLVNHYPDYISFALNRMIAKINLAKATDELKLYQEGLEEWKEVQKNIHDDNLDYLEPELSENIMTVLNKTGDYEPLDNRYKSLDLPNRMQPVVLEIVVQSLIDQQKVSEALRLVNAAKTYHQYGDVIDIQFIEDLENRISKVDNIDELKGHYFRIFNSEPGKLIRIFPENLNGRQDLNEFIVKEIVLAADKLLEKIKSIEDIADENKYNDLIELILDSRINPWGWHVGAQSRGAYSDTGGPQPGERDLPIQNRLKGVMMVCEAFINRSVPYAQAHLKKVFNYHHKRNAFVILVYDLSPTVSEFEKKWKKYCNEVVPTTDYPVGFEIKNGVKEVSKDFCFDKSAIKICSSEHGGGTTQYHIFVNINYKVSAP